jgi:flagellar protein FliT
MEIEELISKLRDAFRVTRLMRDAAFNNQWEDLPELERLRDNVLAGINTSQISTRNKPAVGKFIREIRDMNDQILQLGREQRECFAERLVELHRAQQARKAYSGSDFAHQP